MTNKEDMDKTQIYYMVGRLQKSIKVEIPLLMNQQDLPLKWIDGMVGACPVFSNLEDAVKESEDGKYPIVPITLK